MNPKSRQKYFYYTQTPKSGPKKSMNPQSAAIAGSGNPIKSPFESEIRAKIFSKSADLFAFSRPLSIAWMIILVFQFGHLWLHHLTAPSVGPKGLSLVGDYIVHCSCLTVHSNDKSFLCLGKGNTRIKKRTEPTHQKEQMKHI